MNECLNCPPAANPLASVVNLTSCPGPETPSSAPVIRPGGGGPMIPGPRGGNAVWLDGDERAIKQPAYVGQLGVQQDNWSVWVAISTNAGAWTQILNETPDIWREMVWGELEFLKSGGSQAIRPVINPIHFFQITELVFDVSELGATATTVDLLAGNTVIATAIMDSLRVVVPASAVQVSYQTLPPGTLIKARITASNATTYLTARGLTISGSGRYIIV